jgi:hypothetical protein
MVMMLPPRRVFMPGSRLLMVSKVAVSIAAISPSG